MVLIDCLCPQHLEDLTNVQNREAGQRLISRLTDFVNIFLTGMFFHQSDPFQFKFNSDICTRQKMNITLARTAKKKN